ncbi:hypothetical protein KC351_g57 [Hortaea werneckii]|nr:hypothetical protein KC351_g57 [Hortaea werneckii]
MVKGVTRTLTINGASKPASRNDPSRSEMCLSIAVVVNVAHAQAVAASDRSGSCGSTGRHAQRHFGAAVPLSLSVATYLGMHPFANVAAINSVATRGNHLGNLFSNMNFYTPARS